MFELKYLLKPYSKIPNVKGKNFLGNWIINQFGHQDPQIQNMLYGFKLELHLEDRIQRQMYIKRVYEQSTVKNLLPLLKKAKVFFDIGANIGYFSVLAAHNYPDLKVYSFEPLPQNTVSLKNNIALNQLKNISLIEACVSDQNGEIEFSIPPQSECGWGRISYKPLFNNEKIVRKTYTLDSFIEQHKIHTVDFIKMDIEGFEFHVLKGAENLLRQQNAPNMCIEMNDICFQDMGIDIQEVFSYLKDLNYQMFFINKQSQLKPTDKPTPENVSWNYFAIKK